jgi:ABC-type lipoprotein release transport system permease subunit
MLLRIAWRNLWRYRRRTLITASGMALAMGLVMSMACMQDGMFDMMSDVLVRQTLGHAQVVHPQWPSSQLMHDTIPEDIVTKAAGLPEVTGASGRMFVYALAASETTSVGARFIGIDPKADRIITDYDQQIVEGKGRFLSEDGATEVVIGADMATELGLGPGDELLFLGQAADGGMATELLEIVGIFRSGLDQLDRTGAYVHLSTLQSLLALDGRVHQVMLVGHGIESSAAVRDAVRGALGESEGIQVNSWEDADPDLAKMMGMRDAGLFIMMFIMFSVAGLGVLGTMLMSVFERTRELGVMRSLGMTRLRMMAMILLESVLLCAVASVLGLVFGGFLDWLLIEYGFPYATADGEGVSFMGVTFPPRFYGILRVEPIVITVVFMHVVAFLAALWPALRVARLRPVEAMREH